MALLTLSLTAHSVERITYYHNDHLGSPVAATDTQGNVVWRESYQPDGTRIQHQGDSQNKLWFTGKQEEATYGVSYFGARWYDPEIGRFLAMNPVGVSPKNHNSFNCYAYANNNPYRFVDPDGRNPGDPFTHPALAARDFGLVYNNDSILLNREFGSTIYSYTDGDGKTMYSYNVPKIGSDIDVNVNVELAPGQKYETAVHAHGRYVEEYDHSKSGGRDENNTPSDLDRKIPAANGRKYVTVPNGTLLQFDGKGMTRTISTDLPSDYRYPSRKNTIDPKLPIHEHK